MAKIRKDTSLRKAILQAAITGQLISDVEGETETGKQLLDRIIEERKKMSHGLDFANAKSGKRKSKKETALAGSNPCDIPEDEIPFEIPESWCWCRLGDLIQIKSGDGLTSTQMKDGSIPVYGGNGITGYHNDANIHEETIVIGRVGFYCGSVHLTEKEAWVTDNAFISNYSKNYLNRNYLITALRQLDLGKQQNKTAQPVVSGKKIYPMLFPLPPLAVQNAIVAKLEEVLPLVDAYENAVLQKEELKSTLPDTLKKAILQEAIQGKLTEEWRKEMLKQVQHDGCTEETGKQLLDRIIEERKKMSHGLDFANAKSGKRKSKKETALAGSNACDIPEDEIPFEIPESWCWCRLGDVGDWKAGSTPSRSNPEFYNGNIPWLKTGDLTDGFVDSIPEYISEKALESCSMRLNPIGSVLIAMYGATIGKLGILNIEATTNQACCACVTHKPISNKYLFYYLMSQKKSLTEKAEGGAQPNISREKLVIHPFPLPPLAEQEKIVEIIDQMLPLCEKLGG